MPAKERSAFFWRSNFEMLTMIVEGFQEMGVMTLEECWCKANAEYEELKKWANAESEKVAMKLKRTGKYKHGLDTNSEAYALVHEEYKRRTLALFDKYDLPNKPEL